MRYFQSPAIGDYEKITVRVTESSQCNLKMPNHKPYRERPAGEGP